ncbi:MAG: leucine-rich repeat protein [Bacilli bacterium]|nr:leucine-rich repeat protein [Bacilli bacterium]
MENERKVLICPKCGSEIEITENQTLGHCSFCNSLTPLPFFITNKVGFDSKTYSNMLNRVNKATNYSLTYQFHRAFNLFDKLIKNYYNLDVEDYYPYFGKVLAQYGVCYSLNDKLENELICLKVVKESIFENENYLRAIELSDVNTEAVLKQTASLIDAFQKEVKKELIHAEPIEVCLLVDDREINPNAKIDLALAERIEEKLNTIPCKCGITKGIFGEINKQFVIDIHKQILIADHLVIVSTNEEHLNDSVFRHIWMSYFIDTEIITSIDKRISIITDTTDTINSLPISKLTYFKSTDLASHLEFMKKTFEEIKVVNEQEKEKMPKYEELIFLLNQHDFDKVRNLLNEVLKQTPLNYVQWWIMFLAKHQISKTDDIENRAINLDESYYFQKAFISAPRFVKRSLHSYYLQCKEALEKLSLIDDEYEKEIVVAQKHLYKKESSSLVLSIFPILITTLISFWTLSIANVVEIIFILAINGFAYYGFLKKLFKCLSIGKISRNITTEEEKFNYLQQIKKALKPEQAAKFIPSQISKKIHRFGYIVLTICLILSMSFLVKELVVKVKNRNLSYYYVFNEVVITGGSGEEVIIPKTIGGKTVTKIGRKAFYQDNKITEVIINNGIVEIGSYAFAECKNLKKVTVPATIERLGTTPFIKSINIEEFLYQGTYFAPSDFLGPNYQTEMFVDFVTPKTQ